MHRNGTDELWIMLISEFSIIKTWDAFKDIQEMSVNVSFTMIDHMDLFFLKLYVNFKGF